MTLELVKGKTMQGAQKLEIPLETAHQLLLESHFERDEEDTRDFEFWYRNDINVFIYPDGSYTITLEAL